MSVENNEVIPAKEIIVEEKILDIKNDNTDLIEFMKEKEQIEKEEQHLKIIEQEQKQELIEEEQEQIKQEMSERETLLYEENVEFQENLIKEINELKEITYQMSLSSNEFDRMIYNESISLHNDIYIFIGIFISAFVTLIFARSWFGNAL